MEEKTSHIEHIDDVLKSVSDEVLAKKKKKRIISFSIISSICLALVITVITMSVVEISTKPSFIEKPNAITVTINKSESSYISDNEKYNDLWEIINDSFSTKYLSALFGGDLGYKIEEDKYKTTTFKKFLSNGDELGSNYVCLKYDNPKTLYTSQGQKYKSVVTIGEKVIEFNEVYFTISDNNTWEDTTFYFNACSGRTDAVLSITARANTYSIYQFVNNRSK